MPVTAPTSLDPVSLDLASLELVATCAVGLEGLLHDELAALGLAPGAPGPSAVPFRGDHTAVWRANLWLRTANRVLVQLGRVPAHDGDELWRGTRELVLSGAFGVVPLSELFEPERTLSVRASASRSALRDVRYVALRFKDGIVDAQRAVYGRRSNIARRGADLALRGWLERDQASLLLDTSREPLDRRGYRAPGTEAPLREQLAAAVILAAGAPAGVPVVDLMCGAGTLLVEAGWIARGIPPGVLRSQWAFEGLPGFEQAAFAAMRGERRASADPPGPLYGFDADQAAVGSARRQLRCAALEEAAQVVCADAFAVPAPAAPPGLVVVNPPYGARLREAPDQWQRLGDLLKRRYAGFRAAVLAGDEFRGKHLGLRPRRRLSVRNGPLEARILVLDLY